MGYSGWAADEETPAVTGCIATRVCDTRALRAVDRGCIPGETPGNIAAAHASSFAVAGGLRFQRAVHSFVTPILVGPAGQNALWPDAEANPPYCEPQQTAGRQGRERGAVVRTNRLRQAKLAKR